MSTTVNSTAIRLPGGIVVVVVEPPVVVVVVEPPDVVVVVVGGGPEGSMARRLEYEVVSYANHMSSPESPPTTILTR
ncbi:MAG: hypothetical protein V3U50_01035, partial [Acidimicrobiia bacterium]